MGGAPAAGGAFVQSIGLDQLQALQPLQGSVDRAAQHAFAFAVDDADLQDGGGAALLEIVPDEIFNLPGRKMVQIQRTINGNHNGLIGIEVGVVEIGVVVTVIVAVTVTVTVICGHDYKIPPARSFRQTVWADTRQHVRFSRKARLFRLL